MPIDAVSDQLGHASIHVTKDVYIHLLPGSREKTAKAMEDLLYGDDVEVIPLSEEKAEYGLVRRLARTGLAKVDEDPLIDETHCDVSILSRDAEEM